MNRIVTATITFAAVFAVIGCGSVKSDAQVTNGMRAGRGEPTFAQAYDPGIKLPVEVASFESNLKRLGLKYDKLKGPDPASAMPLPSSESGVNRSDIAECLQIYGKRDDKAHSMEIFRAYVNKRRQVFFIENAFAYTGP